MDLTNREVLIALLCGFIEGVAISHDQNARLLAYFGTKYCLSPEELNELLIEVEQISKLQHKAINERFKTEG